MGMLFKSSREREKDQRRERRHAFRQAENAIANVQDRVNELDKKAKKQWDDARKALASGQKAAANRLLVGYRAAQVIMVRLEQKKWVFEQYTEKLRAAGSDAEFAAALAAINKIMAIDPDKVVDAFDDSSDILADQSDADREWNKLYEKEMTGAGESLQDHIPSLDELAAQLDAEASDTVPATATATKNTDANAPNANAPDLANRITNAKQRVDKILRDGDKNP